MQYRHTVPVIPVAPGLDSPPTVKNRRAALRSKGSQAGTQPCTEGRVLIAGEPAKTGVKALVDEAALMPGGCRVGPVRGKDKNQAILAGQGGGRAFAVAAPATGEDEQVGPGSARRGPEPAYQARVHPRGVVRAYARTPTPFADVARRLMSTLPEKQLEEVRRIFQAYLKKKNLRQTPERFLVLDAIYATSDHVDADELYLRLKQEGNRVSRATVYNTLDLLLECDLVVRHQFGKNQAKYERAYSYWQHDHLICLDCNELMEFCDPRIQSIQEMVAEIYQFEIKHHSLNLYGRCLRPACPNRPAPVEAEDVEATD